MQTSRFTDGKLRFRGDGDLPQVSELRNGRNWNSRLAGRGSVLNPSKSSHTIIPPMRGMAGLVGTPFPLCQVLSLTLPDAADALGRLPRAERYWECEGIACEGILETPLGGVK